MLQAFSSSLRELFETKESTSSTTAADTGIRVAKKLPPEKAVFVEEDFCPQHQQQESFCSISRSVEFDPADAAENPPPIPVRTTSVSSSSILRPESAPQQHQEEACEQDQQQQGVPQQMSTNRARVDEWVLVRCAITESTVISKSVGYIQNVLLPSFRRRLVEVQLPVQHDHDDGNSSESPPGSPPGSPPPVPPRQRFYPNSPKKAGRGGGAPARSISSWESLASSWVFPGLGAANGADEMRREEKVEEEEEEGERLVIDEQFLLDVSRTKPSSAGRTSSYLINGRDAPQRAGALLEELRECDAAEHILPVTQLMNQRIGIDLGRKIWMLCCQRGWDSEFIATPVGESQLLSLKADAETATIEAVVKYRLKSLGVDGLVVTESTAGQAAAAAAAAGAAATSASTSTSTPREGTIIEARGTYDILNGAVDYSFRVKHKGTGGAAANVVK